MINVLSLCDGISGAKIALDQLGIESEYYASEVDKYAIKVSETNYPNIHRLGDIEKINNLLKPAFGKNPTIDLLIAGTPCQNLSIAGDGTGLKGEKSKLFYAFADILKLLRPRYFILENVSSMKNKDKEIISEILGVEPIKINSSLVSAQNRNRYYWTDIKVKKMPEDKNILLKDILEKNVESKYMHSQKAIDFMDRKIHDGRSHWDFCHHSTYKNDKSRCVTANYRKGVPYNVLVAPEGIRKFTPLECERLQTLPEGYTNIKGISDTQRYKMIGNGFTISTIKHILSFADFKGELLEFTNNSKTYRYIQKVLW